LVLVHGDTTTALAASLAAFYQKIPVGHVEAGLRSFDIYNPFPEEINRRVADSLCALHFAPTATSKKNLLREGISPQGIFVTGNTGIDALKIGLKQMDSGRFPPPAAAIRRLVKNKFILITAHRRENFGRPLRDFCRAVHDVAVCRPDIHFVYPVHLNPNVLKPVRKFLGGLPNVHLLPPLDYAEFIWLMRRAYFILTDSGGIQEEAPSLGKPVLVLRKVTERPEAVKAGTVEIVGTDKKVIMRWLFRLINDKTAYTKMARAVNPYGDGKSSERILNIIEKYVKSADRN
jgi:UDP-N-acetylglucosamine 2-epimerase (non-hydrolysing)